MEILEPIESSIGNFVQGSEITKHRRFLFDGRIYVYMKISQPLPESVEIEYQHEV